MIEGGAQRTMIEKLLLFKKKGVANEWKYGRGFLLIHVILKNLLWRKYSYSQDKYIVEKSNL